MKKLFFAAVCSLLLVSCGVGNYSVSSGKADECFISFTSNDKQDIEVTIDGAQYIMQSVKTSQFKTDRRIKETSRNTLKLAPGTHEVSVKVAGNEVYTRKLYISTSEHKVVEL